LRYSDVGCDSSLFFVLFLLIKHGDLFHHHKATKSMVDTHGVIHEHRPSLRKQHLEHQQQSSPKPFMKPHLVSRIPNKVLVTSDVRGNLGPASVVIQAKPGSDWIHDRWQAASDMHGTQIHGAHWVQLEFQDDTVVVDKIILDWETAYADEYILEASSEKLADDNNNSLIEEKRNSEKVWTLFDGRNPKDVAEMRSVTESGRSPGVKEFRPLHVVHEIRLSASTNQKIQQLQHKPIRFLRLSILKSVTGWGVSLWQLDVYGFCSDES